MTKPPRITIDDILAHLPDGVAATESRNLLRRAYDFAGGPDARQPLHVAYLLAELHLGPAVIAAGLLHATPANPEQLREQFGVEVATLVEGVARLEDVEQHVQQDEERSRDLQELESLRKVFIAMAVDDVRIIFIKLADRLYKMRTLATLPPAEQQRAARETADIFAPLANRLGIWRWKAELEDLSFRVLNPEMYGELAQLLDARKDARQARLTRHIELLRQSLAQEGLTGEIKGRPKHIYSIYLKMRRKDVPFSQIYDAEGLRVIVETETQCYRVLGVAHRLWTPVPGEFDDYIANSKTNGYQSLHTAVIGEDGRPLEIQIRTPEMDHIAEFGVAATHWRYKEQHSQVSEQMAEYITQMRQGVRELLQETEGGGPLLEEVRSDIFDDRVYVFTPKGKIIDLPAGATPVDFAYQIHTDIGHRCRGAEVNGTWTALGYRLKNGDRVKIVTGRTGGPSRDWLNAELGFAKTARARQKIKQWFRQQSREENITRGRLIVERELKRLGLVFTIEEVADFFAKRYPRRGDFLLAVGIGEVTGERIVNRIEDVLRCRDKEEAELPDAEEQKPPPPPTVEASVNVQGTGDLLTRVAGCCRPLPGEKIIGYVTRGRGVTIHRRSCPNILRLEREEPERLIELAWGRREATFPVQVVIMAYKRSRLYSDISAVMDDEGIDVSSLKTGKRDRYNVIPIYVTLEVPSLSKLNHVLRNIEQIRNVIDVRRTV